MKSKTRVGIGAVRVPEMHPCACTALRKASRAVARQYEMALGKTGVSATQYSILRALQREGALPLTRLAEIMVLERTSLYRTIRPLERDGLVKTRGSADRRAKEIVLTVAGERKIEETYPHWVDAQQSFVNRVGIRKWKRLAAELAGLTDIALQSS